MHIQNSPTLSTLGDFSEIRAGELSTSSGRFVIPPLYQHLYALYALNPFHVYIHPFFHLMAKTPKSLFPVLIPQRCKPSTIAHDRGLSQSVAHSFFFSLSPVFDFPLFFLLFRSLFSWFSHFFFLFLKSNYSAYFEYFDAVVVVAVVFLFLCIVHFEVLF